ncbi:MAG: FMN-binding protein [Desulfovibrio aminophilus]|uniref:FMN-binding protein n=1 Tax=Desulfovibrio aminophilus TaxID=81425 RepID=UPI0039EAA1DA
MKEFLRIALNLLVISLVSAALLGLVFTRTENIRKRNEQARLEASMGRYLDPTAGPAHYARIHRYLMERPGQAAAVGYVLPVRGGGNAFLLLTPDGEALSATPLDGPVDDEAERDATLARALPGAAAHYADSYILALDASGHRMASFIQGRTGGFKTWVHLLVALGPDGSVKGLEILRHEEDPGLGAEIEQEYFRNQFAGRTLDELRTLGVVRLPLPEDYRRGLERSRWAARGITPEQGRALCAPYGHEDIHAITGATISSRRVTEGVKRLVLAFVKRMETVESTARAAGLEPAF